MNADSDVVLPSLPWPSSQPLVGPDEAADEAAGASPNASRHAAIPSIDNYGGTFVEPPISNVQSELMNCESNKPEPGKSKQNPMKRTAFRRLAWGVSDELAALKREVTELRGNQNQGEGLENELASLRCEVDQLRAAMHPESPVVDQIPSLRGSPAVDQMPVAMLPPAQGPFFGEGLDQILAIDRAQMSATDSSWMAEAEPSGELSVASSTDHHNISSKNRIRSERQKRSRTTGPTHGAEEVAALRRELGEITDAFSRMHQSCEHREQKCSEIDAKVQQACERLDRFQGTVSELRMEISSLKKIHSGTPIQKNTKHNSALDVNQVKRHEQPQNRTLQLNAHMPLMLDVIASWRNECLCSCVHPKTSLVEESLIVEGGLLGVQERILKVRKRLLGDSGGTKDSCDTSVSSTVAPEDFTILTELRNRIQSLEEGLMDKARAAAQEACKQMEVLNIPSTPDAAYLCDVHELRARLEVLEESRRCQRVNEEAVLDERNQMEAVLDERNQMEAELRMRIEPLESMMERLEKGFGALQQQRNKVDAIEQQLSAIKVNQIIEEKEAGRLPADQVVQRLAEEKLAPICEQLEIMRDELVQKLHQTEALCEEAQKQVAGHQEAAHVALISDLPRRMAHLEAGVDVMPGRFETLEKSSELTREVANSAQSEVAVIQCDVASLRETVNRMARDLHEGQEVQNTSKKQERRGSSITRRLSLLSTKLSNKGT